MHDAADLVARRDLLVDLEQDLVGRLVARGVGLLERLLAGGVELLVDREDALLGDGRGDRAGDRLDRC